MILVMLAMTSCRTKQKIREIERSKEKETQIVDSNTVSFKKDSTVIKVEKEKEIQQIVDENLGDIIIRGKTDSTKDFHFHNIVEGDTISDILISGKADFVIKNKWKQVQSKVTENTIEENLNIVAEIARTAVAKKTIKETAKEIKKVQNTVKAKGFQAPIYLILGLVLVVAVIVYIVIKQFKK